MKKTVIFHTTTLIDSSSIVEAMVLTLASSVSLYPWSNMQLGMEHEGTCNTEPEGCMQTMTDSKEQSLGKRLGLINVSVMLWS